MYKHHSEFVGLLMVVLLIVSGFASWVIYPFAPNTLLALTLSGIPYGQNAFWILYGLPLTMLGLTIIWAILPGMDPSKGLRKSRYVYDFVFFLIIALLSYAHCLVLAATIDMGFSVSAALVPALALFFFAIGAVMPRMERNWFMGIRTPWTLSSDRIWKKTHEMGSVLFMLAGIVMLSGLFFPECLGWVLVLPIVTAALICVAYSYLLYRDKRL